MVSYNFIVELISPISNIVVVGGNDHFCFEFLVFLYAGTVGSNQSF